MLWIDRGLLIFPIFIWPYGWLYFSMSDKLWIYEVWRGPKIILLVFRCPLLLKKITIYVFLLPGSQERRLNNSHNNSSSRLTSPVLRVLVLVFFRKRMPSKADFWSQTGSCKRFRGCHLASEIKITGHEQLEIMTWNTIHKRLRQRT